MAINACPLVSIITPVYNGSEYLESLIQSVLDQDYPNIEHIIIDDGSQDNGATVSILRKYSHLHWWSRPNKGQYATMNEGLLVAQGEIICFVSADDVVTPGAVSLVIEYLEKHTNLDGVFGATNYIDANGKAYPLKIPFRMAAISFIPYFAHVSHCSLYIKRSSLQKCQLLFNPTLRLVGDYEWMIRISKSPLRIGKIDRELSKVRIHPNQISRQERQTSLVERRMVLRQHHINKFYHFLLSNLYFLCSRILKVGLRIKYSFKQMNIEPLIRRK